MEREGKEREGKERERERRGERGRERGRERSRAKEREEVREREREGKEKILLPHLIHDLQSLDVGVLGRVELVDDERPSIGWEIRDPGRQLSGRRDVRHRTRTSLD